MEVFGKKIHPLLRLKKKKKITHLRCKKNFGGDFFFWPTPESSGEKVIFKEKKSPTGATKKKPSPISDDLKKKNKLPDPNFHAPPRISNGAPLRWSLCAVCAMGMGSAGSQGLEYLNVGLHVCPNREMGKRCLFVFLFCFCFCCFVCLFVCFLIVEHVSSKIIKFLLGNQDMLTAWERLGPPLFSLRRKVNTWFIILLWFTKSSTLQLG